MASPATTQPAPAPPATNNSFEQFVTRRLERASNQVKIVDLASSLLLIATVVLGVLLVVCVMDAWIVSLGPGLRLTILLGLLIFALVVMVRSIGPLLFRRINPAYAAKMIEQSEPKFKNSLLNYVFLRGRPNSQARRVFEAVQEKAAQDLSSVEIENAIDHSRLIQIGFALVAVTLASGLYKLLSPKDPFATIARVVAPLSDLQAPSRVRVLSVEPGSVELFFGEILPITADIRGAGANTSVQLWYSTDDGQRVNAIIPLTPGENKNEYVGNLTTSESGIQQSLSYWVVAGDGRSPTYTVKVRPSPTIAVSTIDLRPPAYTELPGLRLVGQADIDAIEGTSVHLEATANLAIANATLELLRAQTKPSSTEAIPGNQVALAVEPLPTQFDVVERISMAANDRTASADFKLLRVGTEQKFTHYRLKFATPDGQRNRHEPVYAVRIRPDIAPEIEVLEPTENKLRVPVNGKLAIKVRAMDPDFRISAIRLVGSQKGKVILEQNLTLDQPSGVGNVQGQFRLRPDAHQLQSGDEIVFHLIAKDNRRSPISDQPDPNVTRSANFELTITPPVDSANRNQSDESGESEQDQESNSDAQESPEEPSQNSKSSSDDSSEKSDSGGEKSSQADGGNAGESEGSKDSQDEQDQSSSGASGAQKSQSKSQKNQNPGQNGTGNQSSESSSSDQPTDSTPSRDGQPPKNSGNESQSNDGGESSAESDPSQSGQVTGQENSANDMPGETNAANDAQAGDADPSQGERNSSEQPTANPKPDNSQSSRGASTKDKQPSPGEPSGQEKSPGDRSETSPSKPIDRPLDDQSTEGERFEKLMERMERERNKSNQATGAESGKQNSGSQSNGDEKSNQESSSGDPSGQENSSQSKDGASTKKNDSPQNQSPEASQPEMQDDAEKAGDSQGQRGKGDQSQAGEPDAQDQAAQPSGANDGKQPSGAQPKSPSDQASDDQADENANSEKAAQPNSNNAQSRGSTEPSESDSESSDQVDSNDSSNPSGESNSKPDAANPQRNQMNQSQFPDSSSANTNDFQPTKLTPEEREHLEQSRKVTDLVLDYLKDQQHRPNADLLNEMNWTDQELREFVRRWEQLKVDATQGNSNAEMRYLEALRSLGLPTAVEQARRAQMKRDQLRDLREDGAVSRPPEKFAEAFRDFSKGRAKSGKQ